MRRVRKVQPETIEVQKQDLWVLLLSTIRYSMGRQSYMPNYCRDLYKDYSSVLTEHQKKQIAEEVADGLRLETLAKGHMGSEYDVNEWKAFLEEINRDLPPQK